MRKRLLAFAGALALVAAAATAWQLAPHFTGATVADLLAAAQSWRGSAWTIPALLAAFFVGGFIAFPVNLLIALTIVVLGPMSGAPCALAGALLSAIALHEAGRALPERFHARITHLRWTRLRDRLLAHGVLAVATVRLVPVAPYSVVSLASGMLRVRRADYLAGTALGMAPGVALYALFAERAEAALRDPHPLAWLSLFGVVAALVAIGWFAHARGRVHGPR
ncbi:TVP38/TMEM64 family protein [Dokdonella sp.]|uniref:TVP38/TMEM64 family protein n=1 Tax=Dokdonella sp. TaxID=2291710 RepID=UPI003782EA60